MIGLKKKFGKIRLADALTRTEKLAAMHAGATGMPLGTITDSIRAATIDAADADTPAIAAEADKDRMSTIATEIAGLDQRRGQNEAKLAEAKQVRDATAAEMPAVVAKRPPSARAFSWATFAAFMLLGDGAFTFSALADALGIDITTGFAGVGIGLLVVSVMTLLAVGVNVFAGIKATSREAALRRIVGWMLLLLCGLALAILRGAASADASAALALFGLIIAPVAGYAAGEAHHRIAPYLRDAGSFRARLRGKESETDNAGAKAAEIENELATIDEERAVLAAEADALARAPEREMARRDEQRRLLEARLAAAKYFYELGATMAGRRARAVRGEEGDDD